MLSTPGAAAREEIGAWLAGLSACQCDRAEAARSNINSRVLWCLHIRDVSYCVFLYAVVFATREDVGGEASAEKVQRRLTGALAALPLRLMGSAILGG